MSVIRGRAALWWTDTDDTMTGRTLLLREPLRELRPAHTQSQYVAESLDKTNRAVFTVGEGADELVGRIRYADNPQGLLDVIKAGSKGRTIVYIPDTADADVRYSCLLIEPNSPATLGMDPDRGVTFGDLDVDIRLRKTDETPFLGVSHNVTLFSYHAGDRIEEGTFSRAGVASYPELAGGGGYGTLTTAASGAARLGWYSTASSAGPRTFPALLLEEQRTNWVRQSENFASTLWGKTITATSGQTDPRGGTAAFLLSDGSTAVTQSMAQSITITASSRAALSWFLRQGTTNPSGGSELLLRTTNGATTHIRANVQWSSGRPTAAITNRGTLVAVERWRGGWYRVSARTTAAISTGNYSVLLIPAIASAATKGNVYAFGAQVETA